MSKTLDLESDDTAIEIWKIRKLIRSLENARGNGTSMVSLVVPPRDQVPRLSAMLTSEMGTAVNIKSRVNRASVLSAITSVQQRLKLFSKIPDNGLAIYSGEVIGPDGKEKKISIDITPFKPIASFLYRCDSCFHTGPLKELLEDDQKFGFIVLDGSGCLFGCVTGGTRTVLQKFNVDLPKKHGRGGQSALRFARLRLEKRHNYLRKVAETAVSVFISGDRPNVAGLVLAGSAEFKNQLSQSEMFDPRLASIVTAIVDVSYGGENGFNQAIELAADSLANVKFVKEKRLLSQYFNEIARDTGKYCYGIKSVMSALELSAIEAIICWEGITANRYELRNAGTGEISYAVLDEKQATDHENFKAPDGNELEVVSIEPLVDWLSNNYKSFGATLHFVTNKSQEGSQFVRGFGGIGGIMRYKLDLDTVEFEEIDEDGFI